MMIPVSPPEAFALRAVVESLSSPKKERVFERFQTAQRTLRDAGLEEALHRLAFSDN